ncbi:MAG: hypothetical protein NC301_00385 [Bacteroides sp.]|nr:hypothetical protein [Bacteroides sp.]MCM1379365.1 hypothetical protein [Bacteroides sp.]MCM1445225.1 hypothetical protein [Prevotella sp.]
MKKSLLVLSMLAVAVTAAAYDVPEAGTADSPNYYIIKANRGNYRYLGYAENPITLTKDEKSIETHLCRTQQLSEANIWEITPGTAEGTVVIKNYTTNQYLLGFINYDNEVSYDENSRAVTVSQPANIQLSARTSGAYAITLVPTESASGYFTLDATSGNDTQYCGNWAPDDNGSCWWFYKLDMTNGADAAINAVLYGDVTKEAVEAAVGRLQAYKTAVPQVATELQAGIDKLNALKPSADYATAVSTLENEAIANANTALATVLNGNTYAIENVRRKADNVTAYLTVGDGKYVGATTYAGAKSIFKFTSTDDGGYTIYNAATNTWIGASAAPASSESEAQSFFPLLSTSSVNGVYSGIVLNNGVTSDKGINWQSWDNGSVSIWSNTDAGNIFSLLDFDIEEAVDNAKASVETSLSPYITNVPQVANIMNAAIEESKNLTYSETLVEDANAIVSKAIADGNDVIKNYFDGKTISIYSVRQKDYLKYADGAFGHATSGELPSTVFKFAQIDGGYGLYNEASNIYIGTASDELTTDDKGGANAMIGVDEAEARVITPILSGGALALYLGNTAGGTSVGLNQNSNPGLFVYNTSDGGSIWTLTEVDNDAIVAGVVNGIKTDLNKYVENLPMISGIVATAVAELDKLTLTADLETKAAEIQTNAIDEANQVLSIGLANKSYALKNVRYPAYVNYTDGQFCRADNYTAQSSAFLFKPVEGGGYKLYNVIGKVYVGPQSVETYVGTDGVTYRSDDLTIVNTEDEAQVVYPFINQSGNYYGASLCFNADHTGSGINMNYKDGLHSYDVNDGGSIIGLFPIETPLAIKEISNAVAAEGAIYDLQGRRLAAPIKGINIINGKKILVK